MFLLGIGKWAPKDRMTEQLAAQAMNAAYSPEHNPILEAVPLPESMVELAIEQQGVTDAPLKHQAGPGDDHVE